MLTLVPPQEPPRSPPTRKEGEHYCDLCHAPITEINPGHFEYGWGTESGVIAVHDDSDPCWDRFGNLLAEQNPERYGYLREDRG